MNSLVVRLNTCLIVVFLVIVLPLWGHALRGTTSSWPILSKLSQSLARERQNIRDRSQLKLLNLLMPESFLPLVEIAQTKRSAQSVDLDSYARYFQQAGEFLPAPYKADAHAMLGFCYTHQKKFAEAYATYLKAIDENPAYLWNYTNAAYLRFREGDYEKTVLLLNEALKLNPQVSLQIVASSKIYTDILKAGGAVPDWPAEFKKTYNQAARLMVISLYRMGKFQETIEAARFGITSGFEPFPFFYYYIGLALKSSGQTEKAQEFLSAVGAAADATDVFTGQDISVRIF